MIPIETEWRVTLSLPGRQNRPLVEDCPTEEYAREWAELERRDYPHATVTVERRKVTPWRPA